MPPRIPRLAIGQLRSGRTSISQLDQQICFFCQFSRPSNSADNRPRPKRPAGLRTAIRKQSTTSSTSNLDIPIAQPSISSRVALRQALIDLQKHAGSYVNISRLQLALRGLEQAAGQETIRVAILGLSDGGSSLKTAKELLRLLVADPLKTEEEWERILVSDPPGNKPVLLKIGTDAADESIAGSRLVQELHVSSPLLNGHDLEILVLEMNPIIKDAEGDYISESILVPTMEIPTSSSGRYTPVTTPVHKSLLFAQGISGAAAVLNLPVSLDKQTVAVAVELQAGVYNQNESLPFQVLDVGLAKEALETFRSSVDNALIYEKEWFESGISEIADWLKDGSSTTDGSMKPAVQSLIESVVFNAKAAVETERLRQLSTALSTNISSSDLSKLQRVLAQWAEKAHTELRDELDIAFEGRRWRKLGWWKLFWRVDDVSMIATDILNQRFLTDAEKQSIFLAGKITQSGVLAQAPQDSTSWAYKPIEHKTPEQKLGEHAPPTTLADLVDPVEDIPTLAVKPQPWPLQIPIARQILTLETIPALQALAQKLMLQTLSTSSFFSALGCLMYVSSVTTTFYEAGAVVAVGVVWSLRRMQGKWEAARKFWEGEVREEGRKAVREVEGVVGNTLKIKNATVDIDADLAAAMDTIERAEKAVEGCK